MFCFVKAGALSPPLAGQPYARLLVVQQVACLVKEQAAPVRLTEGTAAATVVNSTWEPSACSASAHFGSGQPSWGNGGRIGCIELGLSPVDRV